MSARLAGSGVGVTGIFVFQVDAAPEPSTIVLTGSGLLFVIGTVRRRSRKIYQ